MILALDLGGTHLRVAAGSADAGWLARPAVPRPTAATAATVIAALRAALADLPTETVAAIGVAVAGLVSADGTVERAENLGWQDVPLARELAGAFLCPVRVETDVFCGASYEARHGAARGARCALYVAVGTGIGHAFVVDGRVWRGAHGYASAIGHSVLDRAGRRCYCGNAGCLCTVASGRAWQDGADPEPLLAALAQAIGVATTLMEPDLVVLAGGALAQPWFDLPALQARLPLFAYPGLQLPRIVRSSVDEPNLHGAALLAEEARR
jgi:glucokinase